MNDQKILYCHGKKFLVHVFEKISQFLAVLPLAGVFSALSLRFPDQLIPNRAAVKGGTVYFRQSYIGQYKLGQSRLTNLDNKYQI